MDQFWMNLAVVLVISHWGWTEVVLPLMLTNILLAINKMEPHMAYSKAATLFVQVPAKHFLPLLWIIWLQTAIKTRNQYVDVIFLNPDLCNPCKACNKNIGGSQSIDQIHLSLDSKEGRVPIKLPCYFNDGLVLHQPLWGNGMVHLILYTAIVLNPRMGPNLANKEYPLQEHGKNLCILMVLKGNCGEFNVLLALACSCTLHELW